MGTGIGGHEQTLGRSNEWLTPIEVVRSLGEFDLDPCAPVVRPWQIAKHHFTIEDDGLLKEWFGRVFLNPPYDRRVIHLWMKKMAEHFNGISLIFARTETDFFQRYVFPFASSILFVRGRITFCNINGKKGKWTGGAPSVLIAYGEQNSEAIADSGIKGAHLPVTTIPIVIVGVSPTWRSVVTIALNRVNGEAELKLIYEMVERIAPDKVANNSCWQEKIRQTLQLHFERIKRGRYTTTKTEI